MYSLPYFKAQNHEQVLAFMHANPFVTLVGKGVHYPVATMVPVLIEERDGKLILRGHIMRKTDHQLAFVGDVNALAIFNGPHSYISASWYKQPQSASTWNYQSVQVKGKLQFTDGADLLDLLEKLTARFENDPQSPALFDKLPKDYVDGLVKAIVAFEIHVEEIDHTFKLSQNRDPESFASIVKHLRNGDYQAQRVADAMLKLEH